MEFIEHRLEERRPAPGGSVQYRPVGARAKSLFDETALAPSPCLIMIFPRHGLGRWRERKQGFHLASPAGPGLFRIVCHIAPALIRNCVDTTIGFHARK
jgi:hypothetical protein